MTVVKVKYFGLIAETVKKSDEEINADLSNVADLTKLLVNRFPELKDKSFKIAVNHNLVISDFILNDNDIVAVLPPFAGG